MKALVLKGFSGLVLSASAGKEIEITDSVLFEDLQKAGYITGLESEEQEEAPAPKRRRKK